ncbi:MAG: tRNA epoxyqueuosine(34) reductase QueG [Planctomycetaceae bacterium]|nr:tRNA epoxyqueuosine(34) reductase QueG [Planctomycetaceae bacterium]
MNGTAARERIVELARAEGFALIGFAPAGEMPGPREAALAAFREGRLAEMAWMTPEWLVHATNPGAFLPGARTVIVLALPCHAPDPISPHPSSLTASRGRVARYARGRDYHRVFEKKLRRIARTLRDELGAAARATVDYGPLLERPLAVLAGAGWQGKSAMLLVPGFGPWVMLGAIATDLEVEPGASLRKSCGSCTRCLAACPTGALSPAGHVLDSRLCISYHTIENRGPIPHALRPKFGDWIFGCDVCQEVCPWNRFARKASDADLRPRALTLDPDLLALAALTEVAWREAFRGSAVLRAGFPGFRRNLAVALGNTRDPRALPALRDLAASGDPLVEEHARWGIRVIDTSYKCNE